MAVNDAIWIQGESKLLKSTGATPTAYWISGQSVIIHEYVTPTTGLALAIVYYRTLLSGEI